MGDSLGEMFAKVLKERLATESHHSEDGAAGGLASSTPCHSASKSGPKSGYDNMDEFNFQ
jgi:hypothetical protein